jgi:predicted Co/Zn/Cd cation transporter (cation efflux family)
MQRRKMPHRNPGSRMNSIDETLRLGRQLAEINAVVPGIVSRRVMQFAWAGTNPSRSDRKEMSRMAAEKWQAASQSAMAMTAFAMEQQMQVAQSFWQAIWAPWMGMSADYGRPVANPVASLLNAGIAPYHRIATANARRLGKR